MVGRDSERKRLDKLWSATGNEKGKAALVKGEAGIGKSKLIYESKKQIRSAGFTVKECRCLPEYQNNALHVFLEMLKRDLGICETMDEIIKLNKLETALAKATIDLELSVPILCSWLTISPGNKYQTSSIPLDKQKQILFNALEKLILHSGNEDKFLLVIEDLHWIDPTSLELLDKIIRAIDKRNCFLLMTARPEFTYDRHSGQCTIIELGALPKAFTKELMEDILRQKKIDEKAVRYIDAKSDGIPLFIKELTIMLHEKKQLVFENEHYRLAGKIEEKFIPVTLEGLLNSQLDRLGFAKETAQVAATIGRVFEYDLLVKASQRDEAMVRVDVDLMLAANLIYNQHDVQGETYMFRHAMLRDAAYEGMLIVHQQTTRARIDALLENKFPE